MYFEIDFFCESCKESKSGYVSRKCIPWETFEQIGIDMVYLHIFLITVHEIDAAALVHLEPFQTYVIETFCENS